MRSIHAHEVTDADKTIGITAMDAPGNGGANHYYAIDVAGTENGIDIRFQDGPVAENGVNGITQEVLLAVAIDRLQCFQRGPFACRENAIALTHIETAMMWLQQRTRDRIARQVEGTMTK